MTLDEAIEQLITLGEKDPLTIVQKLRHRHGEDWLHAELIARDEDFVAEYARQKLGHVRRAATLPAVVADRPKKRELMISPIFIPGVGWKSFGDCTDSDLEARQRFYIRAAGSMIRLADWLGEYRSMLKDQGVEMVKKLRGPLPELPEAEAV